MNRIQAAFRNRKALVTFITGGDPDLETTAQLIEAMAQAGADLIEIGIPFSDPIAEGPVIQAADERALAAGCTVDRLFGMVSQIQARIPVPLLFMTYINPIFAYGKERFMTCCAQSGIAGIIVPDLPYEEKGELADICKANGVSLISMVAPTSGDRIAAIAQDAEGFVYGVSSLGVTGVRSEIKTDIRSMLAQVRVVTSVPCAVGFGVSTPAQAEAIARVADGVIVGSAIVTIVAEHGRASIEPVQAYVRSMRDAIDRAGPGAS
jgi:tryptophan synthase alpha chain